MRSADLARRHVAAALLLPAALLVPVGCQITGPNALANGRALYNEVLTRSGDEQVLAMIVRCRYDETFGMLEVASVTSQVHVGASAAVNAGIGPEDGYAGNLVPFAAGLSYEESPTISYSPLTGEEFISRLAAPVSLAHTLTLAQLSRVPGQTFDLMVSRINGVSRGSRSGQATAAFRHVSALLHDAGDHRLGELVASGDTHYLYLHDYGGGTDDVVHQLIDKLQLTAFDPDGRDLLIPIRPGLGSPPDGDAILLETRSVLDLVRMVGDSIEIPGEDIEAGIVAAVAPADADEPPFIRIRSGRERPADAAVAVLHRGWWFYIDATDISSKRDFVLLRAIISIGIENSASSLASPVLTIPVR